MVALLGRLRGWLFGINPAETTFARRGFHAADVTARQRLEQVGDSFVQGYHAALAEDCPEALVPRLEAVGSTYYGFAVEGAAMALALRDRLTPWRRDRWRTFVAGPAAAHVYMAHVGAGWALARLAWLPGQLQRSLVRLDPLLRWLALDGYGFHEGYFHWPSVVTAQAVPRGLTGYACRAFDQGLGRSLWFVDGADVERLPKTVAAFPPARQSDLWSGLGLACAYAGGIAESAICALHQAAGPFQAQLAQGAAFAAQARRRAGNPAAHTDTACRVLCGLSATAAAAVTEVALEHLPADGLEPAYEVWRCRIQAHFAHAEVAIP